MGDYSISNAHFSTPTMIRMNKEEGDDFNSNIRCQKQQMLIFAYEKSLLLQDILRTLNLLSPPKWSFNPLIYPLCPTFQVVVCALVRVHTLHSVCTYSKESSAVGAWNRKRVKKAYKKMGFKSFSSIMMPLFPKLLR